jgi:hypothetical protein
MRRGFVLTSKDTTERLDSDRGIGSNVPVTIIVTGSATTDWFPPPGICWHKAEPAVSNNRWPHLFKL